MGVVPNPKMAIIFPISCILALIFPILMKYFPKCIGKGSFPKSQIKSLLMLSCGHLLFIAALWSPAGKGLTAWLLLVMFIVFLLLSHIVSWVRCGT